MKGFTLVELVVIIVIVGILAVAAIPRFANKTTFEARGFSDEVQAMLRYGQKVAVAQRTAVFARLSGGYIELCYDSSCTQYVMNPANKDDFRLQVSGSLNVTAPSFSFDALGRPNPGPVTYTVSATGEPTRQITIEQETGYVYQ